MLGVIKLFLLITLTLALSCTGVPGIRGGIVNPQSEEALQPESEMEIIYAGERGVVRGLEVPQSGIRPIQFGDTVVHVYLPQADGWEVFRHDHTIIIRNQELEASLIMMWVQHPDLEIIQLQRDLSRRASDTQEISEVTLSNYSRRTAYFYLNEENRSGMGYATLTDNQSPLSGIILFGTWSTEHNESMTQMIPRIANGTVITQITRRR